MRRSLVAMALLLAACALVPADRPQPIAYGEAGCDFCHMTIESDRQAAQLVPVTGTPRSFDEAGCLMHYVAMTGDTPAPAGLWVHDETSGEWMDARAAFFVVPSRPVPGMMYGILAYRDRASADEARGEGRVADFHSLLAELRT